MAGAALLLTALGWWALCGHRGERRQAPDSMEAEGHTVREEAGGKEAEKDPDWEEAGREEAAQESTKREEAGQGMAGSAAQDAAERGKEMEEIAAVWQEASDRTIWPDSENRQEITREILAKLGEKGYVAADCENQADMAGAGQMEQFCKRVEDGTGTDAELVVFVMDYPIGLTRYTLTDQRRHTVTESPREKEGNADDSGVNVEREYYQWDNGKLIYRGKAAYRAGYWEYTKEGYLFFSGSSHLESRYVMELWDGREYAAWRVKPLDERCRELNRKYILPIGYGRNNLFLCDWSEEEPGELDFQDLFEKLYPLVNKSPMPYTPGEHLGEGAVYRIPGEEFEKLIGKYFQINKKLRERMDCFQSGGAYEYRPRGFYETEVPEIPFPEVVGFLERPDGTIALTVQAVYKEEATARAFVHEVVVRPLGEGEFQYVSNRMLSAPKDAGMWWHTDRLTEEEWEEIYGNTCSRLQIFSRDRTEKAIWAALPPLAPSSPWILTAKNSVRPEPVAYPTNQPFISRPSTRPVPVLP